MSEDNSEYKPIINILKDILGDSRTHNSYKHQMAFDCPVCSYDIKALDSGDGKGNLEVNYKQGVYKCWSCSETHETHGTIYKLIKNYGKHQDLRNYMLFSPDYEANSKVKRTYQKVRLPKEIIYFSEASDGLKMTHYYKRAWNYLKGRNITEDLIKKHKIGFCYEGEYANRIIIPSYNKKGILNYFISRSYEKYVLPKYKNPEAEKEKIIWNQHLIDWKKPIYLVEGVFDHIFLPNSIPLLGKVMSEKLFFLLYKRAKKIIIVLDPDTWEKDYPDTEKLYGKLNGGKLMNKIWYIKLTGDDDIAELEGNIHNYEEIQYD